MKRLVILLPSCQTRSHNLVLIDYVSFCFFAELFYTSAFDSNMYAIACVLSKCDDIYLFYLINIVILFQMILNILFDSCICTHELICKLFRHLKNNISE